MPHKRWITQAEAVIEEHLQHWLHRQKSIRERHSAEESALRSLPRISIQREEAEQRILTRCRELAQMHGFQPAIIRVKLLRSRWGSCSVRGNLNFNILISLLPPHLFDYVILHELCHLKVMSHGKPFWDGLNALTKGQARELNREMRLHSRLMQRDFVLH